jgi:DNA-dependent protein kinase catalytic subunit
MQEYPFLAKGGEDLRKDERIQTLFQVMGGLLKTDSACTRSDLRVRTFYVLPLSVSVGLLQFVPNTETLQSLVQEQVETLKTQGPDSPKS